MPNFVKKRLTPGKKMKIYRNRYRKDKAEDNLFSHDTRFLKKTFFL